MSTAVQQQPLQPNTLDSTTQKIKIDPKPSTTSASTPNKKNVKKQAASSQASANPKANQSSPFKGCVPIAAKPNTNQVPLALILAKPPGHKTLPQPQKTQQKQQTKQITQPSQQLAPNTQQQQQQPRIIFNGNLQSILAAVGSNPNKPQHVPAPIQPNPQNMQQLQQFYQFQQQPACMQQKTTNPMPPAAPSKPLNTSLNTSGGNTSITDPSTANQPAVFTATTTADGQVILQSIPNAHQQHNSNMQHQLMQQNILNLLQQQQQHKPAQQQHPYFFNQNQLNQLIQPQPQQQQQPFLNTNPQHFPNHIFTQPVAASTPTPQDPPATSTTNNENALLRQRLLHEEQRQQQLQQQLEQKKFKPNTSQHDLSLNESNNINIKPKKELNQSMNNDKIDDNTDSHLNSSDPIDKRRGRPRLYVKNPVTGKSIKGKRLDGSTVTKPKSAKKSKLTLPESSKQLLIKSLNKNTLPSNSNGLFPSPSTSVSSSNSVKETQEALQTDTSSNVSSDESESSETAVSDAEMPSAAEKPGNTPEKITTQQKVLTHVIEGFMIKESSKPFEPEASVPETKTPFKCIECNSEQRQNHDGAAEICSQACAKRAARRKLKNKSKKSPEKTSIDPTATTENTLEDTTNNLSTCMKSKCKSHHKHRHRHHHPSSSSSSSTSRDKLKKRMKLLNGQSKHQKAQSQSIDPPIHEFSTVSITQQAVTAPKMTFQPVAATQHHNTFNSSALSQSYSSSADIQLPQGDPTEWNCEQVFDFVQCVAGANVAQVFKAQEVDGSALALIRDDHLVNTMQIKLGPALKIMSKFNELKTKFVSL